MKRIANTHELTAALKGLLAEASGPNPSRHELAAKLAALSTRVAGGDQPPVLEAAEEAIHDIASELGSGWRVKSSDFYQDGGSQGYVGEVWAEDTSYFKLRVEVDAKGVADIDPWVYINTSSVPAKMASDVFDRLDVKGDANKVITALKGASKVALLAFEAATSSKLAQDTMFKELESVLDRVTSMVEPKLAKHGWALTYGKISVDSHSTRGGKPLIYGSIGVKDLPESNIASAKARKILTDAAKAVSNNGFLMTLPKRSTWRWAKFPGEHFAVMILQVPFEMGFDG